VALAVTAAGALALGWGLTAGHLLPEDARRLYGYLHFLGLALVYRFDLAHDMDRGFADLVAPGLLPVRAFLVVRLVAGIGALVQFLAAAAILTAVAPGLYLRFAAWHATLWLLVAFLAAPWVLLSELWLRTRLPLLPVAMLAVAALLAAAGSGAVPALSRLAGTAAVWPGSFASLEGLAWRAIPLGAGGLTAVGLVAARHWSPR
jgi:hypothetical protein